jgi:hypothetical protein
MDVRFRAAVEQARKSEDLYFAAMLSKRPNHSMTS